MADIYTSISTATKIVKRLHEINNNIKNAEFSNLLAELTLELAETRNRLSGFVIENAELKEQIFELKNKNKTNDKFVDFSGVSFKRKPSGGFENSVYCPTCKVGMATISGGDMPFVCGKCSSLSGFNSGKLQHVMKELIEEYG